MKRALSIFFLGAALAGAIGVWFGRVMWRDYRRAAEVRLATEQAASFAEKHELENALADARSQLASRPAPRDFFPTNAATAQARPAPEEILRKLESLKPSGPRDIRQAVYWLEELSLSGSASLPAIRSFLARYLDVELDPGQVAKRSPSDRIPLEFAVPPSLRFALFEIVRRVGGPDAEMILAESLGRTGRGAEVAYLVRALEEMSPNQHRAQAIAVARALLAGAAPPTPGSLLDRCHREYLFDVLAQFGDTGYVRDAQSQLVRGDSQVDRSALRYLQQVLGAQAVPLVAQAYRDPQLTNSAGKEPLARLALSYVGVDDTANGFYQETINDPLLTRSHRKNLIEDLNQDGFPDPRKLTPQDLPMIENRLRLIEQLAPRAMDEANTAAFQEAYKDLVNMRAKITGQK